MTGTAGIISGTSISHKHACLEELEAAAFEDQRQAVADLRSSPAVEEAFVIQTCNRVEAYAVSQDPADGEKALAELFTGTEHRTEMGHEESLKHLLRLGAGLESLVLGEDQILGQVRQAYEDAQQMDGLGPVLDDAVTKAIRVGERARTETAINEGVVSLASAAVRLAAEKRGVDGASAAVVGVGEMGRLATKRLASRAEKLVVANRTVSNAQSFVDGLDTSAEVEATGLDSLETVFSEAEIVISATGSQEWIVEPDTLQSVGETFVIDITRPRDIPPAADTLENLTVYDLDRLETVTEKTRQMRREAATRVESIVEEEYERLLAQYKRKRADEVISAMYEGAERIKARELEETFGKLDLDEESEAVVESMADTLVSQLLAAPTNSLREAAANDDWTTIHTALRLFDPHLDDELEEKLQPPSESGPSGPGSIDEIPEHVRQELPANVLEELND